MKHKPLAGNAGPKGPDVDIFWQDQLTSHLRWLRDDYWNGHRAWRAAYFLARAKHWSEDVVESEQLQFESDLVGNQVTFPFISTHIENMVGFLTQSNPRFIGRPRRAQDIAPARVQESLLNYAWNELEFGDQYALALRDFVTIGHCVLASGFAFDEDVTAMSPEDSKLGDTTNYDDYLIGGYPTCRRVNPFLFVKDRWAPDGTLRTARWCGEFFIRPFDDVVEDQNYEKKVRNAMKKRENGYAPYSLRQWRQEHDWLGSMKTANDDCGDEDLVVLCRIYDKRYRSFRVVGLGMNEPLLLDAWPYPYLDGFPYVMRNFVTVANEPYGVGFTHFASHTQLLSNRVKSKMAEHAKKHNAKYIAKGFNEDDDQISLFESDEHGSVIRGGTGASIEPIERPQFGEDLFRIQGIVENDMRRLMWEDQLSSGGNLPGRTSAEEVRTRNRLFNAKLAEIVRSSEKLLRDVGRQVLQHIKSNPDYNQIVRIVGPNGVEFVPVTAEDVRGEVDVDVSAVAREEQDPTAKRQQGLDLLERMARVVPAAAQANQIALQQGVPLPPLVVDMNKIVRYVLNTFDDRELETAFPEGPLPPGNPMMGAPGSPPSAASPQDPSQSLAASANPQV